MPQATQAAFDARVGVDNESLAGMKPVSVAASGDIRLAIHDGLASVEREWRAFEQVADCTVFQSFDWVSTWLRHIGERNGVVPAIVTGRDSQGQLLCLMPLGIEPGTLGRRLTWLGTELCDYNGPLLVSDFAQRVDEARFKDMWGEICRKLQGHPSFRFDAVHFDKMQKVVGGQANPFIALGVIPHANGAYLTSLGSDWESFYTDKRSSSTRRRDRTKRKKLGEFGELKFVTAEGADLPATLATLVDQKSKSFAAMGVTNLFALPGYEDFYNALSQLHGLTHVSRLDVGAQTAAANLGMIFRGSYYHLLASYDGGELSKFGPGAAHMHHLLQYAIEQHCRTFDFTIGDERYKQEWCDSHIVLFDHISPATLRGCFLAARLYTVGRAKHFIKQNPTLWDKAYKVRAAIGQLRRRLRG